MVGAGVCWHGRVLGLAPGGRAPVWACTGGRGVEREHAGASVVGVRRSGRVSGYATSGSGTHENDCRCQLVVRKVI